MISWLLGRMGRLNRPRYPQRKETAPSRARARRGRAPIEVLESREVLSTTGAGAPFATFPGMVSSTKAPTAVTIRFDAGELASDRSSSILLGLYARPAAGSSLVPKIATVETDSGRQLRIGMPRRGSEANARQLFLTSVPVRSGQAQDVTVNVAGQSRQTGGFDLGVFLPGDVNNDHAVDDADLALIDAAMGSAEGQSNFNPAADFNGDGHVGMLDRRLAQLNQGARAVYTAPPAAQSVVTNGTVVVPASTSTPVTVIPAGVTPTVGQPVVQAPGAKVWAPGTAS